MFQRPRALALLLLLLLAGAAAACGGGGGAPPAATEPFVATFPLDPPGTGGHLDPVPPPAPPRTPVFDADAYLHDRLVPLGGFPSDVVVHGDVLYTTDADEITPNGAWIVPLDVDGPVPGAARERLPVPVRWRDLVDSRGQAGSAANPIGFGAFLNDLDVVDEHLAFALVNAGGSDLDPCLSNLVVFDPRGGTIRQVVNLAWQHPVPVGTVDSSGAPIPSGTFVQSGAEGMAYVPIAPGAGRLYVAMTNLLVQAPSWGTVRYPGTVQVYDVVTGAANPVRPRGGTPAVTESLLLTAFNPVAVTVLPVEPDVAPRLLVTSAGTTVYDAWGHLVPQTDARVDVFDALTGAQRGRFVIGKVGLAGTRPALGRDVAGHTVGFFPSAVTGEVYLLRLDGLLGLEIDTSRVAVLRGVHNGIPIAPQQAGRPGGNVTGIALAPDGRTLVVAGFGDLFALPQAEPGRLYLLGLPEDLVTGAGFGVDFVPGSTLYATVPGRTFGALALVPNAGNRPDVYVAVSSPFDTTTYLAVGPASLGSLQTWGLIR